MSFSYTGTYYVDSWCVVELIKSVNRLWLIKDKLIRSPSILELRYSFLNLNDKQNQFHILSCILFQNKTTNVLMFVRICINKS